MANIYTENETPELKTLNDSIFKCEECPFIEGSAPELGWGTPGKIMFIRQSPSQFNREGRRGDSDFDRYFFELLKPLGLTWKSFYFTNLIKTPVAIRTMTDEQLMHGSQHVISEVDLVKPKVVIALGTVAYRALKGKIKLYSLLHPGLIKYGVITADDWRSELISLLTRTRIIK